MSRVISTLNHSSPNTFRLNHDAAWIDGSAWCLGLLLKSFVIRNMS